MSSGDHWLWERGASASPASPTTSVESSTPGCCSANPSTPRRPTGPASCAAHRGRRSPDEEDRHRDRDEEDRRGHEHQVNRSQRKRGGLEGPDREEHGAPRGEAAAVGCAGVRAEPGCVLCSLGVRLLPTARRRMGVGASHRRRLDDEPAARRHRRRSGALYEDLARLHHGEHATTICAEEECEHVKIRLRDERLATAAWAVPKELQRAPRSSPPSWAAVERSKAAGESKRRTRNASDAVRAASLCSTSTAQAWSSAAAPRRRGSTTLRGVCPRDCPGQARE